MAKATASASSDHLPPRTLLGALRAFRKGDFSVRLPADLTGIDGEIAEAFNDVVELNERMTKEFERLGEIVGKEGKIGHRASVPGASGSWAANVDAVNSLIADMVHPTAEMARVIGAVATRRPLADHEPRDRRPAPCAASSCASARSSTPWWTSSAPSPRK